MPTTDVIETHALTKRYGGKAGVDALRDVRLSLPAGGVTAVVGPNGAGKSTLFALLLGFIRPTAGDIRIAGRRPRDYVRERGAAYLPERFAVDRGWTVATTLRTLARLEGLDTAAARAAALRAARRVGLVDVLDRPAARLSRGMLQRLGIAQTLLVPRELVVLDEPTQGLDPLWRITLRDLLGELADAGATVLLASHDLAEVERVAQRAVLLEDGALREVLDLGAEPGARTRYRLVLASPCAALETAFPDAEPVAGEPNTFAVSAAGPAELSARVAALVDAGGIVAAVWPAQGALEARMRSALGSSARGPSASGPAEASP